MIKTLWFMVKASLVIALALWVAEHPGFVEIAWLNYKLRIHVGVFLILVISTILLSIFIYRVIKTVVDFPASYRRYREIKNREKGFRALTIGLTAVAAEDTKEAVRQAERAAKLLDEEAGLTLLLRAQAARLEGREADAQEYFVALLKNKDAAFLGVRGLLQTALEMHDHTEALDLARQALDLHPKQPWILKTVYDLEIAVRDWQAAHKVLDRIEKVGAMDKGKAKSDRVALFLAEAEDLLLEDQRAAALKTVQKAYKLDPVFVPAATQLAKLYNQAGKRKQALSVVKKAWKVAPHPELAMLWDLLGQAAQGKKKPSRMQWFEQLLALNSETADGQLAAGMVALEEKLWGAARGYFKRAEEIAPSAKLYRLLAELEERGAQNEEAATLWLEKAAEAPSGKVWVCQETGRIYKHWSPIARPHGAFNTIEWHDPEALIEEEGGALVYHGRAVVGGLLEAS